MVFSERFELEKKEIDQILKSNIKKHKEKKDSAATSTRSADPKKSNATAPSGESEKNPTAP